MNTITACTTCKTPKTTLHCGICHEPVCKKCAQLPDENFSFLKKTPAELTHGIYCIPCYNQKIAPALDSYNETMERAKNVFVYLNNQNKESRLIRSTEDPVKVTECADREETLLRLAFLAAQANYNALIKVDISFKKTGDTSYKNIIWSGTGIPALVDENKMNRRY